MSECAYNGSITRENFPQAASKLSRKLEKYKLSHLVNIYWSKEGGGPVVEIYTSKITTSTLERALTNFCVSQDFMVEKKSSSSSPTTL